MAKDEVSRPGFASLARVRVRGRDKGAAFIVGPNVALTAAHVVGGTPDGSLELVMEHDGSRVSVGAPEVDGSLDAATLPLLQPLSNTLRVGRALEGERWRVMTRPLATDPTLTGVVSDVSRRLVNARGREVSLLQLSVDQNVGDYGGYSGAAVTLDSPADAVIGTLVEQTHWRHTSSQDGTPPVANILYALPVSTAIDRFGLRDSVRLVSPEDFIPVTVRSAVTRVDSVLEVAVQSSNRGVSRGRSGEDVLRRLRAGLEALMEALGSTNTSNRERCLEGAESALREVLGLQTKGKTSGEPNTRLLALCHMAFWVIYTIRGDEEGALSHALRVFVYEPALARIQYFPDIYRSVISLGLRELEDKYRKERAQIEAAESFPKLEKELISTGGLASAGVFFGRLATGGRGALGPAVRDTITIIRAASQTVSDVDRLRAVSLNALDKRHEYAIDRESQYQAATLLKERHFSVSVPKVRRSPQEFSLYVALKGPDRRYRREVAIERGQELLRKAAEREEGERLAEESPER